MQTFLPDPDFARSAALLDARRLGKQRVEVLQIIRALTVPGYAWKHHPAVLMWKGYEEALGRYGLEMVRRWTELGFGDTTEATMRADLAAAGVVDIRSQAELAAVGALPPWLGDETVHRSHRSALVRKDPELYGPRFADVDPDLPYHWPVRAATVLEAERRRAEAAGLRAQRAAKRAMEEAERAARRRSRAARKGAATRKANARLRAAGTTEPSGP